MCLAVPARVVEVLPEAMARIDAGGVLKDISVALVPEVAAGDYVIVHVGHALGRLDAEEAQHTLDLIAEMAAAGEACDER
ncbi:HypC/HybG/HupF family hydrogenase formation chaperone [Roseospirillum parvum]|uniref:Hydrogenase maturation factor HypC n=1 Tax=Roseospirillum parvum TaxID=83401 RepID=A0A1G8B1V6_9PROT|nr:HypC/HybG/HupF family hydrogenase formation chaperone [Roseospirillum parvum]SDH27146.1 hydrogenase expression/formation protein HypC [Roseospirillum parvum]